MKKPFDKIFWETIKDTTMYLCHNVQNCVLGYCQSDEITLVLVDYYNLNTEVAFKNNVQKLCSITASMCTLAFNNFLSQKLAYEYEVNENLDKEYLTKLSRKVFTAMFDSRCFNVPREDATNCLLWRQKDCYKNSITSIAQTLFTDEELHKKSSKERLQMSIDKGFDWNNLDDMYKLGSFVMKDEEGIFQYRSFDVKENRNELDYLFRVNEIGG